MSESLTWSALIVLIPSSLTLVVFWLARPRVSGLALGLRLLAVIAGAAAVLQSLPHASQTQEVAEVLILADVSTSVTDEQLARLRKFIDDLAAANQPSPIKVLPFATRPLTEPLPLDRWRRWPQGEARGRPDFVGTDVAAALRAAHEYARHRKHLSIVLATDGHHNVGALSRAGVAAVPALGTPVWLHALDAAARRRSLTELTAGNRARPSTSLVLSVRVDSGAEPLDGRLTFAALDGPLPCSEPASALELHLPAATQHAVICHVDASRTRSWDTGLYQITAQLAPLGGGDPLAAETFLIVDGSDAPLLVEVSETDQRFWSQALSQFTPPQRLSAAELLRRPPSGKVPVIVIDGSRLQLDAGQGRALSAVLTSYVMAGGWLVAVHGNGPSGLDQLANAGLEDVLPLRLLSAQEAARQALVAIAVDGSASMALGCNGGLFPALRGACPGPTVLGGRTYAHSFELATDMLKQTVASLHGGDRLALYLFHTDIVPLLPPGPDGTATVIDDPQAMSQLVGSNLLREERWLDTRGTSLCVALHRLACAMKASLSAARAAQQEGQAGQAGPDRGALFVITDAFEDQCAESWVAKDFATYSPRARAALDCAATREPSLGEAVDHLKALGITPQLVLLDPLGAAVKHEAPYFGELHTPSAQSPGLLVKNLSYSSSTGGLFFAGLLPVYQWWRPDASGRMGLFPARAQSSLALRVAPKGDRNAVYDARGFRPRCASGLKGCRDGDDELQLPQHLGVRACKFGNSSDTALLYQDLPQDGSQRPVAASRSINSGTVIAVATDPATSYYKADAGPQRDIVGFWRSILRNDGTARLEEELFLRITPAPAGYRLAVARSGGKKDAKQAAAGGPPLELRIQSTTGALLGSFPLQREPPDDYLWTGVLPAAQLRGCRPCRLLFAAPGSDGPGGRGVPKVQGEGEGDGEWPTVKLFVEGRAGAAQKIEAAVDGPAIETLALLGKWLHAAPLARPASLSSAAVVLPVVKRPRAALPLLLLALGALFLDIAVQRRGRRRRAVAPGEAAA